MRVLVTGATGFIGAHTVQSLLKRGHEVVAVSSKSPARDGGQLQWVQADLLSQFETRRAVEQASADGLVHCAWDTTPGSYWTTSTNLTWTAASLNLFRAFKEQGGRRVVVVGTSAEYCWKDVETLTEGQSLLVPSSLYGICKNSLREILESWASVEQVSWAWGRVFCPFGPEEKEARLIPKLIKRLLTEDELPFDSGRLVRDFLSVVDVGDAFAALAESSVQGPINIASGCDISIRELVTLIASKLGVAHKLQFDVNADPVSEPPRIVADVARLRDELRWQPKLSFEQRIEETCQWWQTEVTNPQKDLAVGR